jgi:hypothetical protein
MKEFSSLDDSTKESLKMAMTNQILATGFTAVFSKSRGLSPIPPEQNTF